MAATQVHVHRVMAALGAHRRVVTAEVLVFDLLLFVRLLNGVEGRRERDGLNAHGRGLSPCAAPGAHGAAERLIHAAHCYGPEPRLARRFLQGPTDFCRLLLAGGRFHPNRSYPRTWTRIEFVLPLTPTGAPKTMTIRSPGDP